METTYQITPDLLKEYKRLLEKYHYASHADSYTEIRDITEKPTMQFHLYSPSKHQMISVENTEFTNWLRRLLAQLKPYRNERKVECIRILSSVFRANMLYAHIRPSVFSVEEVTISII